MPTRSVLQIHRQLMKHLLLVLLATSFACGSSSSSSGPPTYRDYIYSSNQTSCEARARCCPGMDVASCVQQRNAFYDGAIKDAERLISTGGLVYSSAEATRCLDAHRQVYAVSCSDPFDYNKDLTPCTKVLDGILPAGSACTVGEAGCKQSVCSPYPMGVCSTPKTKVGDDCSTSFCDRALGLVCLPNKTCGYPLDAGSKCDFFQQCKSGACDISGTKLCVARSLQQQVCM